MRFLSVFLLALLAGCQVLLPLGSGPPGPDAMASDAPADRGAVPGDRPGPEAPVDSLVPDVGDVGGDATLWDLGQPDTATPQLEAGAPDGPGSSCPKAADWKCDYASATGCTATCLWNGNSFGCALGATCQCNSAATPGCIYSATSLCNECTKLAAQCCP